MDQSQQQNRLAVALAAAALVISVVGAGSAAVSAGVFASNSDKVDGKHAVHAGASVKARKGSLVATRRGNGRLPNNIIKKAPNANKLDGTDSSGFVRAPSRLRVLAAGFIDSGPNGDAFTASTGNVSVMWEPAVSRWRVSIEGVPYVFDQYVPVATAHRGFVQASSIEDDLLLYTFDQDGTPAKREVSLVVFEAG